MEYNIQNYRDNPKVTEDNFIISEINGDFLKLHNINQTIEQFKQNVRSCKRYFVVETGNVSKGVQHTKVYDIKDFVDGQDYTKSHRIKLRIEEIPENLEKFVNFLKFLKKSEFLEILQISDNYQNKNSMYVRKYLTIEFKEIDE